MQLTISREMFADDWIRTSDLWCRKRSLYQPLPKRMQLKIDKIAFTKILNFLQKEEDYCSGWKEYFLSLLQGNRWRKNIITISNFLVLSKHAKKAPLQSMWSKVGCLFEHPVMAAKNSSETFYLVWGFSIDKNCLKLQFMLGLEDYIKLQLRQIQRLYLESNFYSRGWDKHIFDRMASTLSEGHYHSPLLQMW